MLQKSLNRQQLAERLRAHGIGVTHQRLEIAAVLFACPQHLSADQILSMVNGRHAEVSKATVYNTLKLFRDRGLVAEVIVDPARIFYDPETAPHYHLYDTETGQLTDIPADGIQIVGLPPLPPGLVTERVDIIVRAKPIVQADCGEGLQNL